MTLDGAWRVTLIAVSLALDVFAVCVGVGIRGTGVADRVRIGAAFATAEVVMTLVGAGLGAIVGHAFGSSAGYLGFAALVAVGVYTLVEGAREERKASFSPSQGWGLFVAALSISLDSLGIGFSILVIGVPLPVSLIVIAVVSVISTTLGLAFGKFIGIRAESAASRWAGIALILTGLGFALEKFFAR